jgi:hypothetical protein
MSTDWLAEAYQQGDPVITDIIEEYGRFFETFPNMARDLARYCRANESTAVPGNSDATFFNEGQRAVWLHLTTMADLGPADLKKLLKIPMPD